MTSDFERVNYTDKLDVAYEHIYVGLGLKVLKYLIRKFE